MDSTSKSKTYQFPSNRPLSDKFFLESRYRARCLSNNEKLYFYHIRKILKAQLKQKELANDPILLLLMDRIAFDFIMIDRFERLFFDEKKIGDITNVQMNFYKSIKAEYRRIIEDFKNIMFIEHKIVMPMEQGYLDQLKVNWETYHRKTLKPK